MNAFFNSQFNYCPLVWMCHNHTTNRKINRIHERCLRIIYNKISHLLKSSEKKMILSLFTIEIFNIFLLKCIKLAMDCLHFLLVLYLSTKIVILTICDTILSFPDLLLKLSFMRPKAYIIYVQ